MVEGVKAETVELRENPRTPGRPYIGRVYTLVSMIDRSIECQIKDHFDRLPSRLRSAPAQLEVRCSIALNIELLNAMQDALKHKYNADEFLNRWFRTLDHDFGFMPCHKYPTSSPSRMT